MTVQRQHTGRPGTRVLPHETAHRVVAEATMTARVELRAAGETQAWDADLEQMRTAPCTPYYAGRCRVQGRQARDVTTAEDTETVAVYLITVPASVDAVAEQHLAALSGTGDPTLDGRTLVVDQVIGASVRFERDLICRLVN